MSLTFKILKEYLHNAKGIGSVAPDSKICVNSLLKIVPFESAMIIVEFGSASGAVTREIIRRKRRDTVFVSFEKNKNLYASLKESLSGDNVFLLNEDVFNCAKVMDGLMGIKGKRVDCIVSTLPCSCIDFNSLIQKSVLPVLKNNGHFIQYMHMLSLLKGFNLKNSLVKYFDNTVSDNVLLNIPPATIYSCNSVH